MLLYICMLTGAGTIFASLFLLYKKRITLDALASNPNVSADAIRTELFNSIKIASNVPAIGLFVIGLVLVVTPLFIPTHQEPRYPVRGTVRKSDSRSPSDILIIPWYPPMRPSPQGEIVGLEVGRGPGGRFPVLGFSSDGYFDQPIDLNEPDKVDVRGGGLTIKDTVVLQRSPSP